MDQFLGQVFHHYQIQTLLGRKTGRRTFLATDLETRSPVVIKLLLFNPDFTWEDLKLFQREAETLKSLDHSAIPKYLNYFEVELDSGKGFALVQSYIEARSLQEWVQSGRTFSEAELQAIAKELLNILDYLHRRQPPVIHRDIKPSNILLGDPCGICEAARSGNSPGQVYLVDFGSVQTGVQSSNGGTMTIVGTYGYMPLEQFGGQTVPASDLYSLGATLIYGATGHHPDQLPQKEMRILFAEQVTLSPALVDWLRWLTEPSLELRLKSAQQALESLENPGLRESSSAIANKPAHSKITVTSTKQILEILIPPKFDWGYVFMMTVMGVLLVPFGARFWLPAFHALMINAWGEALLLTCFGSLLLIGNGFIVLTILCSLAHQKLRITPREISRAYKLFGIDFLRRAAVRSTITEIERVPPRYTKDSDGGTHVIPLHITIRTETTKFELGKTDSLGRLTHSEADWLAEILSRWLNLPITISNISVDKGNQQNSTFPTGMNPQSGSVNDVSRGLSSYFLDSNRLPRISRPTHALCTVKSDEKSFEIVAPPAPFQALKTFNRLVWTGILVECVFFPIWLILIQKLSTWDATPLNLPLPLVILLVILILLSGFTPIFGAIYWFFRTRKRHQSTQVWFQIDQSDVYLWEQYPSQRLQRRLDKIPRSAIQKLKLVYKKGQKTGYHVGISARSVGHASEKMILVGNRSFWLSQAEAEWLAAELSIWLKLPITEVEVVKGNLSGG